MGFFNGTRTAKESFVLYCGRRSSLFLWNSGLSSHMSVQFNVALSNQCAIERWSSICAQHSYPLRWKLAVKILYLDTTLGDRLANVPISVRTCLMRSTLVPAEDDEVVANSLALLGGGSKRRLTSVLKILCGESGILCGCLHLQG